MTLQLDETVYLRELARVQERLRRIQQAYLKSGNSAAIVFEGWDAAGKGGTIRCMSAVLDPRGFKVWPISAPRTVLSGAALSGALLRAPAAARRASRSSTAPGTGAFSSNGSRSLRATDRNGSGPTARSMNLSAHSPTTARASSRSSCTFRRTSSSAASATACSIRASAGNSATRISATAKKWAAYEEATNDMFRKTSTDPTRPGTQSRRDSKKYARVAALKVIAQAAVRRRRSGTGGTRSGSDSGGAGTP